MCKAGYGSTEIFKQVIMTREKGYFSNIPRFYRWQTFDHICFGYVQGLRTAVPTMSTTAAIKIFLERFDLCEEVYCFENAKGKSVV